MSNLNQEPQAEDTSWPSMVRIITPENAEHLGLSINFNGLNELYTKGDLKALEILKESPITVTGSRNPTKEGRLQAQRLGQLIVQHNLALVSGYAEGIDEEVQNPTISSGLKKTLVFFRNIHEIFTQSNDRDKRNARIEQVRKIVAQHLIIAPYDSEKKGAFYDRNELMISNTPKFLIGIDVSSKETSGTLRTLIYGLQTGKKVIVIANEQTRNDGLIILKKEFPDQLIEVGSAEKAIEIILESRVNF